MDIKIQSLVIDSHDNERLARFWSAVLGWRITHESDEEWVIEPDEDRPEAAISPEILFLRAPDQKIVKNRLHLDLAPKDQVAEVERIIGLGATRIDIGQGDVGWVVLADLEGNEFCVLRSPPSGP